MFQMGMGMGPMSPPAAAAPTLGPNIWPQPTFDGSGGLTVVECSITGGQLVFPANDSGQARCSMASPPAFAEGEEWQYDFTVSSFSSDFGVFRLVIGGQNVDITEAGHYFGTVILGAAPAALVRFSDSVGLTAATIDDCAINLVG